MIRSCWTVLQPMLPTAPLRWVRCLICRPVQMRLDVSQPALTAVSVTSALFVRPVLGELRERRISTEQSVSGMHSMNMCLQLSPGCLSFPPAEYHVRLRDFTQ